MDKKNTMLLTVIAVATLLVAVVGATFAYFSIVSNAEGGTETNFQGQVADRDSLGTLVLDQGEAELYLAVTAADMGYDNVNTKYWAKDSATVGEDKTANASGVTKSVNFAEKAETEHLYTISTAKLTGGQGGTKYECTSTLTATLKADGDDTEALKTALKAEDGKFIFKQAAGASPEQNKIVFAGSKSEFNLKEIADGTATVEVTYQITANEGDGSTQTSTVPLEAGLYLANTDADQNDLANKKIEVVITNKPFQCSVVENFSGE